MEMYSPWKMEPKSRRNAQGDYTCFVWKEIPCELASCPGTSSRIRVEVCRIDTAAILDLKW